TQPPSHVFPYTTLFRSGVARPHATITVAREQATVMLAIDTSRSMRATDVKPSRLGAAVKAADAFVSKIPKKFRIGIVSFATRARAGLPPPADHLPDEMS